MDLLWLVPLLPGAGAALNGLVGVRYFSRRTSGLVACAAMAGALGLALVAFFGLLALPPDARVHDVVVGPWIPRIPLLLTDGSLGALEVPWTFRLDPLSGLMLLVVTGIGLLIHVYSTAYMAEEPRGGVARFFAYLNLFCCFMLVLVLGGNFLVMFVGWEGVGLCSYLLIGYWYGKKSAADAGKKAFITNRVGDWGFVLGVFLVLMTFGSLDFRVVAERAAAMPVEAQFGTLSLICLLLFVGATGKSAQIPLYVWLPDAMEGPTPVSALIHAATMVTAGVYMLGRNAVLFGHAPLVLGGVAVVGVVTALLAATIALVQTDIKRVLAYSTVSQLGYMFAAMGVGAFAAGTFHLMTHAFFKALLFLCSGSVIHAMGGEQDMRRMGGLQKYLPVTFITMLIGTLAIAGVPPLAGFFSKDEILLKTFLANKALWTVAVVTALLTAFYMYRLIALTFLGEYRGPAWGAQHAQIEPAHDPVPGHAAAHVWHGPHEAPSAMTVPLMALAVGAMVAGFFGLPTVLGGTNALEHFLAPSFVAPVHAAAAAAGHATAEGEAHLLSTGAELGLMVFSIAIGLLGIYLAFRSYVQAPEVPEALARRFPGVYRVLLGKYYVDEAYEATVIAGTQASARGLWAFDRRVVDGLVNGAAAGTKVIAWLSAATDRSVVDGLVGAVARTTEELSFTFRRLQTGLIQNYALVMLVGVFAFVTVYLIAK